MSFNLPESDRPMSPDEPERTHREAPATPPAASGDSALVAQITEAYLLDRRRERRWRIFFRLSWLLEVIAVLVMLFSQRAATTAPSGPQA